jgi:hypothetical protein
MNWYKLSQKELWQLSPTGKDYASLDIDMIDRMAFGFSRNDIKTLHPKDLKIKWQDDMNNVIQEQKKSGKSPQEWAKNINLSEPIDVIYEDGLFKVDDGHHRFYAAKILNKMLNVSLTIKDKPHEAAVRKALQQGKKVNPEILKYYPNLRTAMRDMYDWDSIVVGLTNKLGRKPTVEEVQQYILELVFDEQYQQELNPIER